MRSSCISNFNNWMLSNPLSPPQQSQNNITRKKIVAVIILAAGIDNGSHMAKIKADAGWFFLFIFSIGLASFFIFGFAPTF